MPVRVEGEVRTGDVVEDGAGRKAGVLRSVVNGDEHWGLALLRRDVEGLNVKGMAAEKGAGFLAADQLMFRAKH